MRTRQISRVLAGGMLLAAVGVIVTTCIAGQPVPALACTGGGPGGLEELAHLPVIVLGDAVAAGDAVNRAPASTPTSTPAAAPTAIGTLTPGASTPVSPPVAVAEPSWRHGADLAGVGAELDVVRAFADVVPSRLSIDAASRAALERRLREIEATREVSDCTPDRFVARYVAGRRYLVFAMPSAAGGYQTTALFPVEGPSVILHDALLAQSFLGELLMMPATQRRYFSGVDVYEGGYGIAADRVPLAAVLRAIAALRGAPSIAPPDTGSAGLASGRG